MSATKAARAAKAAAELRRDRSGCLGRICRYYYNCPGGCGCGTHEPCKMAKRKTEGTKCEK